ncbi:hypothetical protein ASE13_14480 [Sphingomonas sp. Root241]|nr:hypothetical protein ASE13_14480 [Sphingomonas sp. Root241]
MPFRRFAASSSLRGGRAGQQAVFAPIFELPFRDYLSIALEGMIAQAREEIAEQHRLAFMSPINLIRGRLRSG